MSAQQLEKLNSNVNRWLKETVKIVESVVHLDPDDPQYTRKKNTAKLKSDRDRQHVTDSILAIIAQPGNKKQYKE